MDIYFFDQRQRQRTKPVRRTIEDLKATRRERPESATVTRFKLNNSTSDRTRQGFTDQLGDLPPSLQVSPRAEWTVAADSKSSPRVQKGLEQHRGRPGSKQNTLAVRFPSIVVLQAAEDSRRRFQKVFEDPEDDEEDEEEEDPQKVAFQKAQFAAPNVLAQLTRLLNSSPEQAFDAAVPGELQRALCLRYDQLACVGGEGAQDVHLRHREWQTEAYKDMYVQRKQKLEEEAAEAERLFQDGVPRSTAGTMATSELSPRRRSALRHGAGGVAFNDAASVITSTMTDDSRRTRRRSLDRSRESIATVVDAGGGSDLEQGAQVKVASKVANPGPMTMRYRRESSEPVHDIHMPVLPASQGPAALTRMERFSRSRAKGIKQFTSRSSLVPGKEAQSIVPHRAVTVCFSLLSPEAIEKGWIVNPTKPEDPERETMLQWLREQAKETKAQRLEEMCTAKACGADRPLEIRFYGDSSRQDKARLAALRRGQRKRLDASKMSTGTSEASEDDIRFSTKLPDGSCVAYYPSGRVAVCACPYGPKNQLAYTYAFDDDVTGTMLGMFTPAGDNCCYDFKGMIRLLTNAEGGHLANERGVVIRQWTWPDGDGRMLPPVSYQLNAFLSVHCASRSTATLHLYCRHEIAKFSVGAASGENRQLLQTEMAGKLQMAGSMQYTSHAASLASDDGDLGKRKMKHKRKMTRATSQLEENHVASVFRRPALSRMEEEDVGPPPDLVKIRKNIKSLTNQWMDHLRMASGMRPMSAESGRSATSRTTSSLSLASRSSHSASRLGSRASTAASSRAGGAASAQRLSAGASGLGVKEVSSGQRQHARHQTYPVLTVGALKQQTSQAAEYMAAKRMLNTPTVVSTPPPTDDPHLGLTTPPPPHQQRPPPPATLPIQPAALHSARGVSVVCCPVALRSQLLKRLSAQPPCRCDPRHMPLVTDVELDCFVTNHAPTRQLLIVNVSAASESRTNLFDAMLEDLHTQTVKARRTPCQQVSNQAYRVIRYGLLSAAESTGHDIPILQQRHNVGPGDCLMYSSGKLVFAGACFNGYGTRKRDFVMQIQKTMADVMEEHFLAVDYKLAIRTPSPTVSPTAAKPFKLRPPSPEQVQMQGRLSSLNVATAASLMGSAADQSALMSDLTLSPSTWDTSCATLTKVAVVK